jgi:tetratricopeptide (TPR) repeat protein
VTELAFRLGRVREQLGARDAALAAYRRAAASGGRDDAYRLSAVARCAALYEARHERARAVESYRDLIRNANDRELVAAATTRVAQLQGASRTKQPTPARRGSGVALSEGAP